MLKLVPGKLRKRVLRRVRGKLRERMREHMYKRMRRMRGLFGQLLGGVRGLYGMLQLLKLLFLVCGRLQRLYGMLYIVRNGMHGLFEFLFKRVQGQLLVNVQRDMLYIVQHGLLRTGGGDSVKKQTGNFSKNDARKSSLILYCFLGNNMR